METCSELDFRAVNENDERHPKMILSTYAHRHIVEIELHCIFIRRVDVFTLLHSQWLMKYLML